MPLRSSPIIIIAEFEAPSFHVIWEGIKEVIICFLALEGWDNSVGLQQWRARKRTIVALLMQMGKLALDEVVGSIGDHNRRELRQYKRENGAAFRSSDEDERLAAVWGPQSSYTTVLLVVVSHGASNELSIGRNIQGLGEAADGWNNGYII
jgi:hypothetical protein